MSLKVAVCGAMGKMGQETVKAVLGASDLELAAQIDPKGGESHGMPVWKSLKEAMAEVKPEVCVDFTHAEAAQENALGCLEHGVSPVIGTSGIGEEGVSRIREASGLTPSLIVPNFAIGAILMMRFAEMAVKWMPDAAIVELHRQEKPDAPSGTAMHTAERMGRAKKAPSPFSPELAEGEKGEGVGGEGLSGTTNDERRSDDREIQNPKSKIKNAVCVPGVLGGTHFGIPVHSIRLPGHIAHQMVVFGAPGESLTIRHDSLDRTSFMPGVLLAVRKVRSLKGLTIGLESLMFGD